MQKIAKFEKVSFNQFYTAMKSVDELYGNGTPSDDFFSTTNYRYEKLQLPERSTVGSAGYDFHAPFGFELDPGQTILIPTGIRVIIDDGWFLMCVPRSGLGFKYRLKLDNSVGVIDSDYAESDNEGHIFAKLTNEGNRVVEIRRGDAFMQGIFLPFGITYDDDATGVRNGGFGSTDK